MGVTQDLIRMFTTASFDQIPEEAVDITKKAILDDVGIGLLGYSMAGERVVEYAKTVGAGTPESSLIGDGTKVSCLAAAAANAQMAFDTDFNGELRTYVDIGVVGRVGCGPSTRSVCSRRCGRSQACAATPPSR